MKNDTYEIVNGKSFRGGRVVATDHKFTGEEPDWVESNKWSLDRFEQTRARALRFYNYYLTPAELKLSLMQWMKNSGKYTTADILGIQKAPNYVPDSTVSKLARCVLRGMSPLRSACSVLKLTDQDYISSNVNIAVRAVRAGAYDNADQNSSIPTQIKLLPPTSLASKIFKKVDLLIMTRLDTMLDSWIIAPRTSLATVKLGELLKANEISTPACVHVKTWISQVQTEMQAALDGADAQLVEGYRYMPRAILKARVDILAKLGSELLAYQNELKGQKVLRPKKTKPAEKQVNRVQFMAKSDVYKVTSAVPLLIPGAKQVYLFNTKYRTLSIYSADGPAGFTIKGTRIQGFNKSASSTQSLRKPAEVLPIVINKTQLQISKALSSMVTTKSRTPNGRINKDTLILRVIQ